MERQLALELGVNYDDKQWEARLQKRLHSVALVQQSDLYLAVSQWFCTVLPDADILLPETPDPHNRSLSKRTWEDGLHKWKHRLRGCHDLTLEARAQVGYAIVPPVSP